MQNPAAAYDARPGADARLPSGSKGVEAAARPLGKDSAGGGEVGVEVGPSSNLASLSDRPQRRASYRGWCLALCVLAVLGSAAGIWALITYVF